MSENWDELHSVVFHTMLFYGLALLGIGVVHYYFMRDLKMLLAFLALSPVPIALGRLLVPFARKYGKKKGG